MQVDIHSAWLYWFHCWISADFVSFTLTVEEELRRQVGLSYFVFFHKNST